MNQIEAQVKTKTLRIGHTPDPDDAFLFYGFATGQVTLPGVEIIHILEDIQSLNQKALKGDIEVTAVSAALYPALRNTYWILPVGASVGRKYGPVIVKRAGDTPKEKRIGIPGKNTTAYLLLRLYTEGYLPHIYRFDEIPKALQANEIDYGLLIHEAQVTYADLGLDLVLDLGRRWVEDTQLPIPLGLDVVRKDLGVEAAMDIAEALRRSLELAFEQREEAINYALRFARGLSKIRTDQFIRMYANEDTRHLSEDSEKALNLLFDKAYRAGIYPTPTKVEILKGR
ncbi:MAG: ABC transporter substrate-binding protein [Elusimicrobia bacterium]|nr:ABC transporter substrate-binding protein [Candidatus Obscuribacterium magneticum]